MALVGGFTDRDHQQWQTWATPVPLQQVQFIHHAGEQLFWIIREVAAAFLQHCRSEQLDASAALIGAGRFLCLHPVARSAAEPEAAVSARLLKKTFQLS